MLRFKVIFILGKLGIMLIHFLQRDFIIDPKYKLNPLFYKLVKYILVKANFNKIEISLPVDGKILKKLEYEKYIQERYLENDVVISLSDPVIFYDEIVQDNNENNEVNEDFLSRNGGENVIPPENKLIFKSPEEYGKYIKTLFKKEKKLQELYQLYNIDNKQEESEENYLDELNENEDYKENKLLEKEIEILNFYKNNQINFKYNAQDLIKSFVDQQNIDMPRKIFKNELEIRLYNEYIYNKPVIFKDSGTNKSFAEPSKSNSNFSKMNSEYFNPINTFNEENKKFLFDYDQYEFVDFGEKTYTKLVNYFNGVNSVMWLGKLSPSHLENFDENYVKIVEFLYKRKSYLKQQFVYVSTEGEKKLHESDLKAKKYLMNFFLKSKVSYGLIKRNLLTYLQPPVLLYL